MEGETGTVVAPPEGTPATPPTGTVVAPPTGTVVAPPTGTVVAPPTGTVVAPPTGTVVAPPTGTVVAPPTVTVVAPPGTVGAAPPTATVVAPGGTVLGVPSKTDSKADIKCVVLDTDMTEDLQREIIELAKEAWEKYTIKNFVYKPDDEDAIAPELGASFEVSTQTAREQTTNHYAHMAQYIKTEIDKKHRPCWHVIVGNHFGVFMTHDTGTFIYFDMGESRPLILMFKSGTLDQPLY